MATRKKRGPKHPGVVFIKPDPARRIGWRARYRDPDSGKFTKETLDAALTTVEQREQWAVWKSRENTKRRLELEGGAVRKTGTKLSEAIDRYYKAHPQLSKRSVKDYKIASDKLTAWADDFGIATADDLTRAKLMAFREGLICQPKRAVAEGEKRGTYLPTDERRAPHSVNGELRKVRTVLGYLRQLDLLPRLSNDDLRDALKRLPVVSERIEYLKPGECQELLDAALRHDAETFEETREEHAGQRPRGTTPRYEPIAPFIAFVLMTGMRRGEALGVGWKQVDLEALDNEGRKVGEIHLRGATVKTRKARTVGLEVSPALRKMLAAMKLSSGGEGSVFNLSKGEAEAAAKRLKEEYGAPRNFGWQMLRRTCGTYLTNAPGIFGAASAYRSAKQLGHSVQVAEAHYVNVARGIPRDARTLEAAMQVEKPMAKLLARVGVVDGGESAVAVNG